MRRSLTRWISTLILLFTTLFIFVLPAEAQSKTLIWHRWDSDIQINTDGTFTVKEVYELEFIGGPFTFGFRNIPIEKYSELVNFSVREGGVEYTESRSESPNTYYVTSGGSEYVVNFFYPSTIDETRVFTIEYTVLDGLFISETGGDEVYWKAVGPEHAFPIGSSTVVVHLPGDAVVDTSVDQPYIYGTNATYSIAGDNKSVTFQATNIPVNREFEVGVRFSHGVVPATKPSWQAEYEQELEWQSQKALYNLLIGGAATLLLIGGLLGIYFLWLFAGRDPKIGAIPSYLAEPPSDLPPGLVGTLVDEKADLQDIMATMVDLARRGAIEMEETEKKIFGLTASTEFTFRRIPDYDGELRGYEELLIQKMFGSRKEIDLDDLREKFYSAIPKLQSELYKEAVAEGLFPKSPKAIRGRYLGFGIAGIVLSMGVGFCVSGAFINRIETLFCPFISLGMVSVVLLLVGRVMPAKSRKGAEEAAKWKAFKSYLKSAERYNDLEEVTDQFDRYLPYAIAFGLERTWVNKFSKVRGTPMPGWYIPVGMPRYGVGGMPHMSTGGSSGGSAIPRSGGMGSGRDLRADQVRPAPSLDGMSDSMFGGLSSMSGGLFSMLNSASRAMTSVPHSSGSSSSGGFGGFSGGGGGFSGGGFSGGGGGGGGGAGFG